MTPTGANPATATTPGSGVAAPGYVLNGADVTGFRGQRVQIVGTFAPQSTTGAAGTAAILDTRCSHYRTSSIQRAEHSRDRRRLSAVDRQTHAADHTRVRDSGRAFHVQAVSLRM